MLFWPVFLLMAIAGWAAWNRWSIAFIMAIGLASSLYQSLAISAWRAESGVAPYGPAHTLIYLSVACAAWVSAYYLGQWLRRRFFPASDKKP